MLAHSEGRAPLGVWDDVVCTAVEPREHNGVKIWAMTCHGVQRDVSVHRCKGVGNVQANDPGVWVGRHMCCEAAVECARPIFA